MTPHWRICGRPSRSEGAETRDLALAASQNFAGADNVQRQALAHLPAQGQAALRAALNANLERYRNRQPGEDDLLANR